MTGSRAFQKNCFPFPDWVQIVVTPFVEIVNPFVIIVVTPFVVAVTSLLLTSGASLRKGLRTLLIHLKLEVEPYRADLAAESPFHEDF